MPRENYRRLLHVFEGPLTVALGTEIKCDDFAIDHGRSRASGHDIEHPVPGANLALYMIDRLTHRRRGPVPHQRRIYFQKSVDRGLDMTFAIDVYRASLPSLLAVDGSRLL